MVGKGLNSKKAEAWGVSYDTNKALVAILRVVLTLNKNICLIQIRMNKVTRQPQVFINLFLLSVIVGGLRVFSCSRLQALKASSFLSW